MSKIVFFCIPAHGHTNPTLGVVKELIHRGHEVWYYSYNNLRDKIEATGATFVSCDAFDAEQRIAPKDAARIGKDLAFSTKVLVDTTLALDDTVMAHMQALQPDCIVADSMAVWGKAVAIKLGIPFVSSTTTFAFNQHSAQVMKQSLWELIKMLLSMPKINKQLKRLQKKGYPIHNILDIIQNDNDTHTIVYTSPEFQPCSDTFSNRYSFIGPSIRPIEHPIQKTQDKLIYISMGTVNNDMLPLYKQCIAAFAETEYQVILSVGDHLDIRKLGVLPQHISVYPRVDQIAVLE
ncbi:MAG: glucosyltransferase, partial [Oscillospiraceae bacterium]|nr:glucosyltransferase [Oscillospiraceae bacterium]